MPHGRQSAARRAELRSHRASALSILFSNTFLAGPSLPTCPSVSFPGPGDASAWRLPLGSIPYFGPFNSPRRQHVIDNFLCVVIAECGPSLAAIQWLPEAARRHCVGASLLLFFRMDSRARPIRGPLSFRILNSGIIIPAEGYHGPLSMNSRGIFQPEGLQQRGDSRPATSPYPASLQISDLHGHFAVYMEAPVFECFLMDPSCVTIKIRGLNAPFHRQGVTAAFLQAAGFPSDSFSILAEYYPALRIHGRPAHLLSPHPPPADYSTIFATVFPPPASPSLPQANRNWILHGHVASFLLRPAPWLVPPHYPLQLHCTRVHSSHSAPPLSLTFPLP